MRRDSTRQITLDSKHKNCAWCGEHLGATIKEFANNRKSVISGRQAFCDLQELKAYQAGK